MLQETDCEGQNATSSAYSSLTNSSGELSSNDGKNNELLLYFQLLLQFYYLSLFFIVQFNS